MSITLPFKPDDKVLEIGGGESPLFRPNMDIRKLPTVDIVHDCSVFPWPIPGSSFNGVFAKFLIEHPSWRKTADIIREAFRVLKPDGFLILISPNTLEQCREIARRGRIGIEESAMLYGGQEEGDWNTHRAAFSPDYMRSLCQQAGFEKVNILPLPNCATDMITIARKPLNILDMISESQWFKEALETLSPKPKSIKLNLGSFTVMAKGFENIDILPLEEYAKQNGYIFRRWDLRRGLPYPDASVEAIATSHLLEHLSREEGDRLLREIIRVLKPEAPIRIAVPDTRKIAEAYISGEILKWTFNEGVKNAEDSAEAFWNLHTAGHVTAYDHESLKRKLEQAGFTDVKMVSKGESSYGSTFREVQDVFPELSLYVEAKKPLEPVRKLKIALISTPMLATPPERYGGLESVVADLGEALAEMGHEVTVFAAKGSRVKGCRVVETVEPRGTVQVDWLQAEMEMYNLIKDQLKGLDIIHGHNWFGVEYLYKMEHPEAKVCHTHHGGLHWRTKPCEKPNLIAISDCMVRTYASQGWTSRRVYNGINLSKYSFRPDKGNRLLFVGRLDCFKQPDVAIAVAKRLNMGLDIVGGSFVQDKAFLESIKKLCDGRQIRLYLDASHEEKIALYQRAKAVLFPSRMFEPFGLIIPEANACGSFVIGLRDGAIPELIEEGVNGFVVGEETVSIPESEIMARKSRDVEALAEAVRRLENHKWSPEDCRRKAETMSREAMAHAYLRFYKDVLEGREW